MIRRSLAEWETLPHGEGAGEMTEAAASRVAAAAVASPFGGRSGEGVLEHRRRGLKAKGVVGVVVADGAELEILPKIDDPGGQGGVRLRLVEMLAVALDLPVAAGDLAAHDEQADTVLEIFVRLFSTRLVDAVRKGMPRRYVAHADDLPALRGRMDVVRQFTALAASPERLACRYDALSPDIPLNQIMKATVAQLGHLARAADNRRRLAELSFAYADVMDVSPGRLRWDAVTLDRTDERWRTLLELARLLLGGWHQTTTAGGTRGFSLLFDMAALWEEYVTRLLARALAGSGRRLVAQGGRRFCLLADDGRSLFQTKPDILVRRGDRVEQVIDTKWKRISARVDDPKQGMAQSDVYQMMAYGRLYGCSRLILLYPHHAGLGADELHVRHRVAVPGCEERLELATLDVTKPGRLVASLRVLCAEEHLSLDPSG